MRETTLLLNAFLSAVLIIVPSFQGASTDAFSIEPVALKSNHVARHEIGSLSSPFSPLSTISARSKSFREINNGGRTKSRTTSSSLYMYNLPPGGGGGKNDIADIAKGALSLALVVAFFASPIGGLFLGIFNSFLVLLFVGPLIAFAGFNAWLSFNTIQAPCPNCGAPATVQKNKGGDNLVDSAPTPQSLCFNCGAVLEPNADNTGINNVTGRKTINDLNAQAGQQASIFDFFSNTSPTDAFSTSSGPTEPTSSSSSSSKKSGQGGIDKSSIIDVDVLDEDKPFQ